MSAATDQPTLPAPGTDGQARIQTVPGSPKSVRRRRWLWIALFLAAVGLVGVVVLGLPRLRRAVMCANCQSNLSSIGCALIGYSEDFDGQFPPSWRETYPDYINNARLFKCPATASDDWQDFAAGRAPADSSGYAYVPGLNAYMPGDFVVAYDKSLENHHGYGRCAVRVDAHVEWWPASREAEFQRLLALQKEAVEKWRASGKSYEAIGEFIDPELRRLMGSGQPCRKGHVDVWFDFLAPHH